MKTWTVLLLLTAWGCGDKTEDEDTGEDQTAHDGMGDDGDDDGTGDDGTGDDGTGDDGTGDDGTGDDGGDDDGGSEDELTLDTCAESYTDDVPTFYSKYFACVDVSVGGDGVAMWTDGLPPTPSAYYNESHPNYVEFDERDGDHWQNPGEIAEQDFSMTVPTNPTPKGITIDASMVDNTMNTSDEEYSSGGVGVSLNGVMAFAAMAGPDDVLADEAYTFDLYEGHPAGDQYHYHFNTPGPLEVLVDRGFSDSTVYGEGDIELYALMCDGTVVLGCTELDGSAPNSSDFDAQNGHIHDVMDADGIGLENRYHTHVCADVFVDYPFFPEIAYYDTTGCPSMAGGAPPGAP